MIKLYESHGVYPMHGESCADWGRDCEYLTQCGLNNKYVTKEFTGTIEELDPKVYDIQLTLMDMLNSQFSKNSSDLETIASSTIDTVDAGSDDNVLLDGDLL